MYIYYKETGLYYLRSRYYNSKLCKFLNTDSALSNITTIGSLNLYAYCCNSPVSYHDAWGYTAIAIPANPDFYIQLLKYGAKALAFLAALLGIEVIKEVGEEAEESESSETPKPTPSPTPAPTPKPTPPPDQYLLAFANKDGRPTSVGIVLNFDEAKELIRASGIPNAIRQATGHKGEAIPIYGVIASSQSAARRLADALGNKGFHDEAFNLQHLPHFHCSYPNVHIWYLRIP